MKNKSNLYPHPVITLYLLLSFALIVAVVACTPAAADAPITQPQSYTFYLGSPFSDKGFVPLDPQTLSEQPDGDPLPASIILAGGQIGIDLEYPQGHASQDVEDIWITVTNLATGKEESRYHPPATGYAAGLSANGARLLWQPDPPLPGRYPPGVEWMVLDTSSGAILAHIKDDDNACFRQRTIFDPTGQFIYCAVDPDLNPTDGPQPMRIALYDAGSTSKTAEIELPDALIGGSQIDHQQPEQVYEFLEPALLLSPDGRRLVVVHAAEDKITILDAHQPAIERTISLEPPPTLLDLFSAVAQAKGLMSGTIRQAEFSLDGTTLYVYTQEVRQAPGEEAPEKRGLWAVDLDQGVVTAEALTDYQIQWLRPAPDGSLYAFGTRAKDLLPYEIREISPSKLWRLDGRTLEIMGERSFTGNQGGRIVVGDPVDLSS